MEQKEIQNKKLMMLLGASIKTHREKLAISQETLSYKAGLHRNYISDAERGRRNVSLAALWAIANGLEITLSELVNFELNK